MDSALPEPLPSRLLVGLRRFWAWLPAKYFWLLLIICAVARDQFFPFSHFPMYSRLAKTANYVYVTDGQNQPIALMPQFSERAASLSKSYRSKLDKIVKREKLERRDARPEHMAAAGEQALEHLVREGVLRQPHKTLPPELKLWYVEIHREGNHLKETKHFAGSIRTEGMHNTDGNASGSGATSQAAPEEDDEA